MSDHLVKKFFDYFVQQDHTVVPSSSLIPEGDTSVLLTSAGMQQFKSYYLGKPSPYGNRVVTVQKCVRVDDIEEVGDDTHNTFFEMLGNFSFQYPDGEGSYFKAEAIRYGYEFIAEVLGLQIDYITVFSGDEFTPKDTVSRQIWENLLKEKNVTIEIRECGREDNFWGPTGSEGPCGPTTEIYVNGVEIWNIVFNEYYCDVNKGYTPLSSQGVDTGGGLGRILAQIEKVDSIYDTSLMKPLMSEIDRYFSDKTQADKRIIADHIQASIFLLNDGVIPSNKSQGYVLRRLLRRVFAMIIESPYILEYYIECIRCVEDIYSDRYPELQDSHEIIISLVREELGVFQESLRRGMKYADKIMKKKRIPRLSGEEAFLLSSTYGLSPEILKIQGLSFDIDAFNVKQEQHQNISRAGVSKKFGGHGLILDNGELKAANEEELALVTRLHSATHLLHQVLREIFGTSVQQKGSDITAERLRFDFSFDRKLTTEELNQIEHQVNLYIQQNVEVTIDHMSLEDAQKSGALYLSNRNYPAEVDVYSFGDISSELCGGPHVNNTEAIGVFKILKEEAVARGVRRIRAIVE